MATDFTNNNTTISTSGGVRPDTKNTPLDIRTRVNLKADIDSIPNPFVGMKIIVLQDETNNNEMTEYVVVSLKANSLGVANSKVDEIVLAKDFLGVSGNGMTEEQAQQLNTAYTHSQSTHVQQSDIPTKTSQLQNDSGFITSVPSEYVTETELNTALSTKANKSDIPSLNGYATETFVTNKIEEAQLGGGEVDLSGYYTKTETDNIIQDYTGGKKQVYLTQAEYDLLSEIEKNDATKVYNITDATEQVIPTDLTIDSNNLLQLKDSNGNTIGTGVTVSTTSGGGVVVNQVEPADDDMPKVFFNGDKPTTKDDVYATIEYISKTEHFKGYVAIKCQGTSSMGYPKKNYTIKMFTDETMATKLKKDFKGWGNQNKFCLKANYIDHSHARNVCSAKLWNEIVASRSNYEELPELLRTSPMNGAIDGFPIKVYYNNSYEGVYTWNIPKDKWMFNMDDALDNHCVLCGEEYVSGCFRSANASLWSDEIHDVMPQSITTSFNNFITFVMNSSDEEFKTNLNNYVYVDSLIDYYIFQYVICGLDSMGKNQLFATYDGTRWIATSYDMDSTFGLYWNGGSFVSAQYRMQEDYESMTSGRQGNLLYIRLEQLFINEIKARYQELRNTVLSYTNVVNTFERFMDIIGKDLYAEDGTIYTEIPSQADNNIKQIRDYYRDRLTYVDAQIAALQEPIPCESIALNVNTLSLTNENKTTTLIATVTPDNTTDEVIWSVSPSGICTVEDGVVTAKANGDCVVTATCGSQSASCNVNVSGIEEGGVIDDSVYSLNEERVLDGTSDYIDTGIQLLNEDRDFTIFVDFTKTTASGNQKTLLHCMNEQNPYPGISMQVSGSVMQVSGNSIVTTMAVYSLDTNRHKLVIVKQGSTIKGITEADTYSSDYLYTAIDKNLLIGCYQTNDGTKGRYFDATIHQAKVWTKALSDEEIQALING